MYQLRDYQQQAVEATLQHFRKTDDSAVIVLPTGAGKSLVIAALAKLARKKILILTHVKELVEQNHAKYISYGNDAGIFSAGLKQKETGLQVTFASVQSVARNLDQFRHQYSLVIIDECHRVTDDAESQYGSILSQLKEINPGLKVLGLTATPYRLGSGWIYQYHYRGYVRSTEPKTFHSCIFELPLRYMIRNQYLTPPEMVDAPVAHYDFSSLSANSSGEYPEKQVNELLVRYPRVTEAICEQIEDLGRERQGIMVFAATVKHAEEIQSYLPEDQSALIVGATSGQLRDQLIRDFKDRKIKYLINVSVLTTGFDAPHVDLIAILRPTESVSLYQQIVGRGLRLSEGKKNCLVIDYAGNDFDLHQPEVGEKKPSSDSEPVQVFCPQCEFANIFWGKTDEDGIVIEHHGRRCQGFTEEDNRKVQCSYRFRFKECPNCNAENDIAARRCHHCDHALVDPDDQLKDALKLKDAMVIRCAGMVMTEQKGKLRITYHGEDGEELSESFDLSQTNQRFAFNQQFGRRAKGSEQPVTISSTDEALRLQHQLTAPDFVIARKAKYYWRIKEKIFDYEGNYRKANQL